MLENCTTIYECEKTLQEQLGQVNFIGQLDLTEKDLELLTKYVREILNRDNEQNLQYLRDRIPICAVCLMVMQGFYYYSDGAFWEETLKRLGLSDTTNVRLALSHLFIRTLQKQKQLELPFIKGALRYITPILLHGGIPRSCFSQFFNLVAERFIENKISNEGLIRGELFEDRQRYFKYLSSVNEQEQIQKQIDGMKSRIRSLQWLKLWDIALEKTNDEANLPLKWRHIQDAQGFLAFGEEALIKTREKIDALSIKQGLYRTLKEQLGAYSQEEDKYSELRTAIGLVEDKIASITQYLFGLRLASDQVAVILGVDISAVRNYLEAVVLH